MGSAQNPCQSQLLKDLMANVVKNEVLDSVKTNPKAKRSLITKVFTGRLVKKYRYKTALKKATCLALSHISDDKTV